VQVEYPRIKVTILMEPNYIYTRVMIYMAGWLVKEWYAGSGG